MVIKRIKRKINLERRPRHGPEDPLYEDWNFSLRTPLNWLGSMNAWIKEAVFQSVRRERLDMSQGDVKRFLDELAPEADGVLLAPERAEGVEATKTLRDAAKRQVDCLAISPTATRRSQSLSGFGTPDNIELNKFLVTVNGDDWSHKRLLGMPPHEVEFSNEAANFASREPNVVATKSLTQLDPVRSVSGTVKAFAHTSGPKEEELFAGLVDLVVVPPVDLPILFQFLRRLQAAPHVHIVKFTPFLTTGMMFGIMLSEPKPLLSLLRQLPEVNIAGLLQEENPAKQTPEVRMVLNSPPSTPARAGSFLKYVDNRRADGKGARRQNVTDKIDATLVRRLRSNSKSWREIREFQPPKLRKPRSPLETNQNKVMLIQNRCSSFSKHPLPPLKDTMARDSFSNLTFKEVK